MKTISIHYLAFILLVFAFVPFHFSGFAQNPSDRAISAATKHRLDAYKQTLNYPKTVERYYQSRGLKLSWVAKGNHNPNAETAMMFLDCLSQFGLNPMDYHRDQLSYGKLQQLADSADTLAEGERTAFDVLLTDAMITALNQLHYGKFNPFYSNYQIDNGNLTGLNADFALYSMIDSKDFYALLVNVQPATAAYLGLQRNMQLILGQYILDSYEYPRANVRKMAINMERLRWLSPTKGNHIQVNIPAYQLKLAIDDSVKIFKVIVGKPQSPTETFEGALSRFTAAPEWKVPGELFANQIVPAALKDFRYLEQNQYAIFDDQGKRIKLNRRSVLRVSQNLGAYTARQAPSEDHTHGMMVFRLDQKPDVSLYDHREIKAFDAKDRAISKGCVQIDNPVLLAKLLLVADGSADKVPLLESALKGYHYKNFYLKRPVPFAMIYLTCEMIDHKLVIYKDVYQKDVELENKMFGEQPSRLAIRKLNNQANK